MFEVHVFVGTAESTSNEATGYPVGERHAFLAFLRQPVATDHNWDEARTLLEAECWGSVDFGRAGILGLQSTVSGEMAEMRDAALESGGSIIVYSDPIDRTGGTCGY